MNLLRQRRLEWIGLVVALAALAFLVRESRVPDPNRVAVGVAIVLIVGGSAISWYLPRRVH